LTLSEKVKLLCDAHELTFAALERRLDFGNGTIRKWDSATPSGDKLAKVADFFNVSTDYLLGRDEETAVLNESGCEDENVILLNRGAKNMTSEQRKKLLDVAKVMFQEEFKNI